MYGSCYQEHFLFHLVGSELSIEFGDPVRATPLHRYCWVSEGSLGRRREGVTEAPRQHSAPWRADSQVTFTWWCTAGNRFEANTEKDYLGIHLHLINRTAWAIGMEYSCPSQHCTRSTAAREQQRCASCCQPELWSVWVCITGPTSSKYKSSPSINIFDPTYHLTLWRIGLTSRLPHRKYGWL